MASSILKPSRLLAVAIVVAAVGWIASGALNHLANEPPPGDAGPMEDSPIVATPVGDGPAGDATAEGEAKSAVQRVSVTTAIPETHQRQITLSCTTEADHRSIAVARGAGIIVDLKVERGSVVRAGDVVATLSDEGRESAVKQAQALLEQRRAEYESTKAMIDKGNSPKIQLPAIEAAVAAAEAALANAEAEADRSVVRAPINGVVHDVPVQVGQAIQPATTIAEIIDPDPMLAVGAVSERQRGYLAVGQMATMRFIDGKRVDGSVTYVGLSADTATRTYPVEAHMDNPDAAIPDGVSCEMVINTTPIEAASVPRSALVFSDEGVLGVRIADDDSRARFVPVTIIDDGRELVWVDGIDKATRVIVVGQDFVKDGDEIEAVAIVAEAGRKS